MSKRAVKIQPKPKVGRGLLFWTLFLFLFFCLISSRGWACDVDIDSKDPHKFVCGGDRFFWMGDTAWLFSTNELTCGNSNCNDPTSGNFETYIRDRDDQGFNIIQGNIFVLPETGVQANNQNDESPFCPTNKCGNPPCQNIALQDWDLNCPNDNYLTNVHRRIEYMNSQGITAVIAPTWAAYLQCSSGDTPKPWGVVYKS